jgi:hypothetical protein
MKVIALVLLLALPLGGCATFTAAAIGSAVGLGLIGGFGKFAGESGLSRARVEYLIKRKCSHLKTPVYRARCANRLRYILHQYRA